MSESNDKVKISSSEISVEFFFGIFTGNFFKPSAKLGRVQVARHNLEIKKLYIHLEFMLNKPIDYLLFRGYSMEQVMSNTATTMEAARMEGSNLVSE